MSLPDDDSILNEDASGTDLEHSSEAEVNDVSSVPLLPELAPFDPPSNFDHGEEFEAQAPRPIPKYLRQGSHGRRKRGMIYSLIALGIMFIVFWPIPFVQGLSFYILPLTWLHWIGFGLIVLGVWQYLAGLVSTGRYTYVKNGEPFTGRVLDCQKVDSGTADVPAFRHVARVEFRHPETDQHLIQDLPEPDNWSTSKLNQMSCPLKRGDYVTLVRLPGKDDSSHALYGFLGLDPEREYILKNDQPMRGTSPFTAIMVAFLIAFVVLLLMAAFDVIMFSFPIGGDWKLPTGLAVGGFFVGGFLGRFWWSKSENQSKSKSPTPSFLGVGFLGAVSLIISFFILNSRLDNASTNLEPIEIVEYWNTTHNFIVRDYELEYKKLADGETTKQHMRFSQITRLYGSRYGVEEISPGRFGYPWSKGIHPIYWMKFNETEFEQPVVEFQIEKEPTELDDSLVETVRMIPVISLDNDRQVRLPERLLQPELNYLKTKPGIISAKVIPQEITE